MKILYITTIGITMGFFKSFIKELIEEGNTIDIACGEPNGVPACYKEWNCKVFPINCSRSPLRIGNVKSIKQIKKIVNNEQYDIVHCHTPIAAVCTRLACRKIRKKGTRVFYTAHGFHFYTGAPLKNWMIYFPIEWLCSFWTDTLITINKEDYSIAKKYFHPKRVEYVPGVGIDVKAFEPDDKRRREIRKELELDDSVIMLLSVGELNDNKNHLSVIKAIKGIKNLIYVIVGEGKNKDQLKTIAKDNNVDLRLMGYRTDVKNFYNAADIYILPSIREGLNVSIMEAMASGLACLVSNIRGNCDLIDEKGGFRFSPFNIDEIRDVIKKSIKSERKSMGGYNRLVIRNLDYKVINNEMVQIYSSTTLQ